MTFGTFRLTVLMAAALFGLPTASHAAGASMQARFSFDGVADCPPIMNFPIHGEGTGVLTTDRKATLDINSSVEGQVRLNATLGGKPTDAPGGSATLNVVGRHTLRAVRDYPNNVIIINMTVRGAACTMTIENRLKPGKREYTFYNGGGFSVCSKPRFTHTECTSY